MKLLVFATVAATVAVSAYAQTINYAKIEILTEPYTPNLYMLAGAPGDADPNHPDGAGGRIGLLTGPDGIFMVDSQYEQVTGKVLAAIRKISSQPIRYLANTHLHVDHTGGNGNIVKQGALLIAREELRSDMARDANMDPARLPNVTYGMGDPIKFRMNGEVVDLIPIRAAHTGGDTIVRFENADIIMIGDFYRNYGYPFIDINNGGSLKGALEALDYLMKIAGPNTKLIPGHGTIIKREDIVPYRNMILDVQSKVQEMIEQGKTQQEVQAAHPTASYDAKIPGALGRAGGGTSADRFVAMLYSELKKK
jgi:glyoxylase-like metal-dependent hydrolase (beta-lactamase superfamily II)